MKIILRPWRMEDALLIAPLADNPKIAANLRDGYPIPYSLQDAEAYVRSCIDAGENTQCARAIVADGKPVGSIAVFYGSNVYSRSGEMGYWLGEPYWGQGVMSEAVRLICGEVFAATDIVRIFAEPFSRNAGSRRVLEKAGFSLEGILRSSVWKDGVLQDGCMYALIKE